MKTSRTKHKNERKTTSEPFVHGRRTWRRKFADAFQGLRQSVRQQSSYHAHFAAMAVVLGAAWFLGNFDAVRWSLLVLCITVVIGGEMLNTAIETLARAVTSFYDPTVGRALNIASGAVLTLSFGAAVVGTILFGEAIFRRFLE